jgi:hypothetical protein
MKLPRFGEAFLCREQEVLAARIEAVWRWV